MTKPKPLRQKSVPGSPRCHLVYDRPVGFQCGADVLIRFTQRKEGAGPLASALNEQKSPLLPFDPSDKFRIRFVEMFLKGVSAAYFFFLQVDLEATILQA